MVRMAPNLRDYFSCIELGALVELDDVVIVRLLCLQPGVDAELLEEALEARRAEITEVSADGDVNAVRVTVRGERPLLLIDGEELTGAKQNRILNASFLVGAGTQVIVPVSCVERGRWRDRSATFSAAGRTLSATARADKLHRVATSVGTTGRFDADQGTVWRDVDSLLMRGRVTSRTLAYADLAVSRGAAVEQRIERLAPVEHQVGLAAVRGDRLLVVDLLGSPALFRRGWRKLARGVVVDVDAPLRSARARDVVAGALDAAGRVACARVAAPGIGHTLHGVGEGLAVGAVVTAEGVYHAVIGGA
jgi:hypothetical protein